MLNWTPYRTPVVTRHSANSLLLADYGDREYSYVE